MFASGSTLLTFSPSGTSHWVEPEGQAVSRPEREPRVGEKGGQFEVCRLVWEEEVFFLEEGGLSACQV